ncbi:4'-phosphopantetheinyl transferase family protein [Ruminiclostridium josui]|uniref:4'-phosphopantetheinyl transferase family protein n=1 Tax=Ruminiclostridium josui TaxID=1499 RepID=UPI000463EFE9|nr:4'-phosphopantetheinyl transferase superfamily protein [Ruminiclostridium josui]
METSLGDKVVVYLLDVREFNDKEWHFYKSKSTWLPGSCRQKIEKNLHKTNRNLSLMGWILFLMFVGYPLGIKEDKKIQFGKYGKPYILNSNIHFNISHSYPWVCLATSYTSVGVDIECKSVSDPCQVLDKFSDKEKAWLVGESADNPEVMKGRFRMLWSAKEAWLKYLGCGLKGIGMELPFALTASGGLYNSVDQDGKKLYLNQNLLSDKEVLSICCESEACELKNITAVEIKKFFMNWE